MSSELKAIEAQLKKLNQNIERYLRMIDPTLHQKKGLDRVQGILELDPAKKYLVVFKEDVPIEKAHDMAKDFKMYFPEVEAYFLGGANLESRGGR